MARQLLKGFLSDRENDQPVQLMQPSSSHDSTDGSDFGFAPWRRLKSKRISYLTLPLLVMATLTEFVILATGWKYQQVVCLPQGMGVTFFGIGPIGATILAVELLKLPLAIWTASRRGWSKWFMLGIGLPMICLLTFQLVKDMAVYEMGIAMTPAAQYLEKATDEETKAAALNGELAAIEQKKADHEKNLAALAAQKAKAKADLADALKRNDESRTDAISLTDYQKKELADVSSRETAIIAQFDADAARLNKEIGDLQSQRETELARAGKWTAEEARLENDFKATMLAYENAKSEFEKDKAAYDKASVLQHPFMKKPVDPGAPPVRPDNTLLQPTALAAIDQSLKNKQDELTTLNNSRRDRIAQVEGEAHQLREEFDHRSTSRRDEVDRKRDDLLAAEAAQEKQWQTQEKQLDDELAASVRKVDGIRAQLDAVQQQAEADYEAREAAIRKTQVHRIATTVEIVRGLIKGEKPASIKATAKERGDTLTDQISMVRIWVYPVLAFIVAFLPTLMVEIGFSTVFEPENATRPPHRLGFLGRRLHWLYMRAGRQKIFRAERIANEAIAEIATRDDALARAKADTAQALAAKEDELKTAQAAAMASIAQRDEQLRRQQEEGAARLKASEEEWVAKLAGMADSLNRMSAEKDALRDLQRSEVERQIQARQNAWSDRLARMRQELDDQRAANETERAALLQAHQKRLLELTEESKTQVYQARRQAADAELAAMEAAAKLNSELKDARQGRDSAEAQLRQQADAFALKLAQGKDDAARELEKALRQEKHRAERQQLEMSKALRQQEEDFAHQLKQREQELSLAFDQRLAAEQTRSEQEARRRETEAERRLESRALEVDARWKAEIQQREEAAQTRLQQREQQLEAQAETRRLDAQTQSEQEMRRMESEFKRQLEAQAREAGAHWKQEWQQKEMAFDVKLQQREQELTLAADARETELQNQHNADLRSREEEWERQAEARIRAADHRFRQETQQREEAALAKARQRDQQWQAKLDAACQELLARNEDAVRRLQTDGETRLHELEAALRKEMLQKDEAAGVKLRQREQELQSQFTAQADARQVAAQAQWDKEWEKKLRAATEPLKAQLAQAEKERDEARQASTETAAQAQRLEKKLTEASVFLNGWRNGHHVVTAA